MSNRLLIVLTAVSVAVPFAAFLGAPAAPTLHLVETGLWDARSLEAFGAEVVVDYQNGYALVRSRALPDGLREADHPFGPRTYLDMDIAGIRFDTARGEPALPESLRGDGGAYVVQFIGPVKSEWVRQVEAVGGEFATPFYNYAFAVRAESPAPIRALPFVQWVGDYHAAYKISWELADNVGTTRASVSGWDSVSVTDLEALVRESGGSVIQSWDEPPTVEFTAERSFIDDVARSDLVLSIYEAYPMRTYDRKAGQIHKFHYAWSTQRSSLPYTITGRSPGPDNVMYTADDQFEGIGIQDTGFDEGDGNNGALDFFDSPNGDRVMRFTDRTGCSVPDGRWGDSAHGSHVIGIIASDGYAWEKYLIENLGRTDVSLTDKVWDQSEAGVAPEAKVSIDGIQAGTPPFACGGGVASNPNYWDGQYADGYPDPVNGPLNKAWVVTYSNSYGSGPGVYGTTASAVDTRIDAVPERMILFAAGNDGPNAQSVSRESQGKNGLSVAASQNYRPDQFNADNPNLLADFSGRGPGTNGRIKPDLAAVGTAVVSLFARGEWIRQNQVPQQDHIQEVDKYDAVNKNPGTDGIADYRYLQGTSMSTPHAAGLFALTREYLREVVGGNNAGSPFFNPPSHAAKALLINGAVRMDENLYAYPGPDQGWGRIDLENSLFPPVPRTNQITIGQFGTMGTCNIGSGTCTGGGSNSIITGPLNTNVVAGDVPLKVTLVWLDTTGAALGRDLNLRVTSPSSVEYHGDQYAGGWSIPGAVAYDSVNTVEQVEVQSPEAGQWTIEVVGQAVPSTARFAVVIGADIGPVANFKIDLTTQSPTAFSVAPGGSVVMPIQVLNFGTGTDTAAMTTTAPGSLTVTFTPSAYTLASGESAPGYLTIAASPGSTPAIHNFDVRATSQTDPSPNPAADFLFLTVEILDAPLPSPTQVTTQSVDELDPSVAVFDDATVGRHIFIAYRKSTPVDPANDSLGGVNVWVAHALLDASGAPIPPFVHSEVSGLNDQPNDLRILRIPSGTYANRILITWTGENPDAFDADADSWGRIAFLDAGGTAPYYQGSWTLRTMMENYGSSGYNAARVSYPLYRSAGAPGGEVYWVWEHLDYNLPDDANPASVRTNMIRSQDGGNTWPACGAWDPASTTCLLISPDDSNYYFFPNGVVDQNGVAWLFFYWRTSGGNDRDLMVRLYDGPAGTGNPFASMSAAISIYDTTDNVQWPAALSVDPDGAATNRVYFVVTRDRCGTDLAMYTAYAEGTFSSASPPTAATSQSGACNPATSSLSSSFTGLAGPLGSSISNANYNRRPILNIVATVNTGPATTVWLPVMENANPYGEPNLWSWYTNPGFSNPTVSKITADAFAKGHQMSATLTSGGTGYVYEVWHANHGTATNVNYEVYLAIYGKGWETLPDTLGPVVTTVMTSPSPVNISRSLDYTIVANLNDIATGNSDIASAEYQIDGGAWAPMNPADIFDSPAEGAVIAKNASSLSAGSHQLCVRGTDSATNLGAATCVNFDVVGAAPDLPPMPPTVTSAVLLPPGFQDVRVSWDPAPDEWQPGGTIEYRVLQATTYSGSYSLVGTVAATNATSYTFNCLGCGQGDASQYFWRVQSVDNVSQTSTAARTAAKYTAPVAAGRNLLAVPLLQADYSVGTVAQTLGSSVVVIRTYRNSDGSDPWKAYYAWKSGDLSALQFGEAFWVEVNAPGQYTLAGLVEPNPSFDLTNGWNFVSCATFIQEARDVSLAGIPGVARVETLDDLTDPYSLRDVAPTEPLVPGAPYWIQITGGGGGTWVQG